MKKITTTILILFVCFGGYGQKDTFSLVVTSRYNCDSGYRWMPSLSTSSLNIIADTCLPDSTFNNLWRMFGENLCGETSSMSMSLGDETKDFIPLLYSSQNTWNDSSGCTNKKTWEKRHNDKWIEITEDEYKKIDKFNNRKK